MAESKHKPADSTVRVDQVTTTLTTRWTLQLPPAVVKVVKSPSRSFPRLQSLWSSTLLPSKSVQRRQSQPHRIQVGWLSLLLPILRTSRPPYPKTPPHLPNPFIIKDVVACFLGRSCLGRRWLTLVVVFRADILFFYYLMHRISPCPLLSIS